MSQFDNSLTDFCKVLCDSGKEVLSHEVSNNPGWFERSREFLTLFFQTRNDLLFQARNSCRNDNFLKQKCRNAKLDVKEAVLIAKDKWVNKIASEIHTINFSLKIAWKAIKTLKNGHIAHHIKKNPMRFKLPDGLFTKTDKDCADMLHSHFSNVLNRNVSVDWNFIKSIKRFEVIYDISGLMSFSKLNSSLFKLTWHKAPGQNGVLPNALKALNGSNRNRLLKYINS